MYHVNTCYHYWILLMYIYWHDKPWLFLGLNWINGEANFHCMWDSKIFFSPLFSQFFGARCQWCGDMNVVFGSLICCLFMLKMWESINLMAQQSSGWDLLIWLKMILQKNQVWPRPLTTSSPVSWWGSLVMLYYWSIYMCGWMSENGRSKHVQNGTVKHQKHVANPASHRAAPRCRGLGRTCWVRHSFNRLTPWIWCLWCSWCCAGLQTLISLTVLHESY